MSQILLDAHWMENVAAAATLLENTGDALSIREARALRSLLQAGQPFQQYVAPQDPDAEAQEWMQIIAQTDAGLDLAALIRDDVRIGDFRRALTDAIRAVVTRYAAPAGRAQGE